MKNMIWHGQVETVIKDGLYSEYKPLEIFCKYDDEPIRLICGGASIDAHIDELEEICQRYRARI